MGDLKNRVRFTTTLDPNHRDALRLLSDVTKIPQSELVGEAIDLLFSIPHYKQRVMDHYKNYYKEDVAEIIRHEKQQGE